VILKGMRSRAGIEVIEMDERVGRKQQDPSLARMTIGAASRIHAREPFSRNPGARSYV
jgi:hypothetical protein